MGIVQPEAIADSPAPQGGPDSRGTTFLPREECGQKPGVPRRPAAWGGRPAGEESRGDAVESQRSKRLRWPSARSAHRRGRFGAPGAQSGHQEIAPATDIAAARTGIDPPAEPPAAGPGDDGVPAPPPPGITPLPRPRGGRPGTAAGPGSERCPPFPAGSPPVLNHRTGALPRQGREPIPAGTRQGPDRATTTHSIAHRPGKRAGKARYADYRGDAATTRLRDRALPCAMGPSPAWGETAPAGSRPQDQGPVPMKSGGAFTSRLGNTAQGRPPGQRPVQVREARPASLRRLSSIRRSRASTASA